MVGDRHHLSGRGAELCRPPDLVRVGADDPARLEEGRPRVSLEPGGVYLDQTDGVAHTPKAKLAGYDGSVVCVVFEFDLGPTGKDTLNVYLNPTGDKLSEPVACLRGEFTFDRLQFKLTGQNGGSQMMVDELPYGQNTHLQQNH